jgi:hypothetical protein
MKDIAAIALVVLFSLFLLSLVVYLPIHFARERRHTRIDAIRACAFLSLLLPPLWFVAMVWAFTEDNRKSRLVR